MEIEEKYFKLLNLLIRDKRAKMNGMISSIVINQAFGTTIHYNAFMNRMHNATSVYVEDIEAGNIVFLLPFGVKYKEEMLEKIAERHTAAIKEFFGDKFRDDMIMRISEEERKEEIRKWDDITLGGENWEMKYADDNRNRGYCVVNVNRFLPFPSCIKEVVEGPFKTEKEADKKLDEMIAEKLKNGGEWIGMKDSDLRECYKVVRSEFIKWW